MEDLEDMVAIVEGDEEAQEVDLNSVLMEEDTVEEVVVVDMEQEDIVEVVMVEVDMGVVDIVVFPTAMDHGVMVEDTHQV